MSVPVPFIEVGTPVLVTRDLWSAGENLNKMGKIGDCESAFYDGNGRYLVDFDDGTESNWVTDVKLLSELDAKVSVVPTIPGSVFQSLDLSFNQVVGLVRALEGAGFKVDITA